MGYVWMENEARRELKPQEGTKQEKEGERENREG
jgi:hypothetical protein